MRKAILAILLCSVTAAANAGYSSMQIGNQTYYNAYGGTTFSNGQQHMVCSQYGNQTYCN